MSSGWVRRGDQVVRKFSRDEVAVLVSLATGVDETLAHVGSGVQDDVLDRLIPRAYGAEEGDAADEFAEHTAARLAEGKQQNARVLLDDLVPGAEGSKLRVSLDEDRAKTWMFALNDIRLALAARLGVDQIDSPARGPVGDVYAWLGWLQSGLIDKVARFADSER